MMFSINSSLLYVVTPTIITTKEKTEEERFTTYKLTLMQSLSDISVAINANDYATDVLDDTKKYFFNFKSPIRQGNCYVKMFHADFVRIPEYSIKRKIKDIKYTSELENYLLSIKDTYSLSELRQLIEELQSSKKDISPNKENQYAITYRTFR